MNRSNRILLILVVIIVIVGVAIGGYYVFSYLPEQEAKEKARLEQIAKDEAEKKRQEAAAQRKARYDQLIVDADAAYDQENWQAASALYSEASSLLPNQQYATDQLTLVNTKLDEIAALEAKKAAGFVETVAVPTGRFYVIVSSSVDGDLAMDYATKLAKEGNDVKIIGPDDTNPLFSRVSVGDYDSWDEAVSAISTFNSYGTELWVLKY